MGERGAIATVTPLPATGKTPGNRDSKDRVKARPIAPKPPTWLDKEGNAEWRRIVGELQELGILAQLDRAVLTTYCRHWSQWVDATAGMAASKTAAAARLKRARKIWAAGEKAGWPDFDDEKKTGLQMQAAANAELAIAEQLAAARGLLAESYRGGVAKHPLLQVQRDNARVVLALARELGVTPNTRLRMNVGGDADDEDDGILDD